MEKGKCSKLRREQAWRIGDITFCHLPADGEKIAALLIAKYADCIGTDVAECAQELERRFLETSVDQLAQWLDWQVDSGQTELREAKRIVEDIRLLSWVGSQNDTQGVAPPPQFVWEQRCSLSIENGSGADDQAFAMNPPRSSKAKKWVQRFRRRWGLVLGRLPTRDMLTVDTMRSKVRSTFSGNRFQKKSNPPSGLADPFWGPENRPRFGAVIRKLVTGEFRKTVPFLGPFFRSKRQPPCGNGVDF